MRTEPITRQPGEMTRSDGPNIVRAAWVGALIGLVVVTAAVALAGILGGIERGSALGLGAFIGIWGGTGFGLMMGATITIARHDHR
jgi:hypothetical protein